MTLTGQPKEDERFLAKLFKVCKRLEQDVERDAQLINRPGDLASEIYERVARLLVREKKVSRS